MRSFKSVFSSFVCSSSASSFDNLNVVCRDMLQYATSRWTLHLMKHRKKRMDTSSGGNSFHSSIAHGFTHVWHFYIILDLLSQIPEMIARFTLQSIININYTYKFRSPDLITTILLCCTLQRCGTSIHGVYL